MTPGQVAFEAGQTKAPVKYPSSWEDMPEYHRVFWEYVAEAVVASTLGRLTAEQLRARLMAFVTVDAELRLDEDAVRTLNRVRENSRGEEKPVILDWRENQRPDLLYSEDGVWFYPDGGSQMGWMAVEPEATSYGIDLFSKDYHCELGAVVEALVPGAVEIRTTTNKGVYVGSEWREVIAYRVRPFGSMNGRGPTVTLGALPNDEALAIRYRNWVSNVMREKSNG